jgi:hypothetical protein
MVSLEKGKFSYETGLNAESLAHIRAHDNAEGVRRIDPYFTETVVPILQPNLKND